MGISIHEVKDLTILILQIAGCLLIILGAFGIIAIAIHPVFPFLGKILIKRKRRKIVKTEAS